MSLLNRAAVLSGLITMGSGWVGGSGETQFGFDQSQVRLYTPIMRHIVLVAAALTVCAVTAAQARTRTPPR